MLHDLSSKKGEKTAADRMRMRDGKEWERRDEREKLASLPERGEKGIQSRQGRREAGYHVGRRITKNPYSHPESYTRHTPIAHWPASTTHKGENLTATLTGYNLLQWRKWCPPFSLFILDFLPAEFIIKKRNRFLSAALLFKNCSVFSSTKWARKRKKNPFDMREWRNQFLLSVRIIIRSAWISSSLSLRFLCPRLCNYAIFLQDKKRREKSVVPGKERKRTISLKKGPVLLLRKNSGRIVLTRTSNPLLLCSLFFSKITKNVFSSLFNGEERREKRLLGSPMCPVMGSGLPDLSLSP